MENTSLYCRQEERKSSVAFVLSSVFLHDRVEVNGEFPFCSSG